MHSDQKARLGMRSFFSSLRLWLVLALVLFVSAGTLAYWEAWLHLGLQAASMTASNLYLLRYDRALLERRLAVEEKGESEPVHRLFFNLLRVAGIALPLVAGLDHRFGWSQVPVAVVLVASLVFAAGSILVVIVFRENTYASSIIEVTPLQSVVKSGPYRRVRHPMYTGILLMMAATPITLGSYVAALFFLPLCGLMAMRIFAEERLLAAELPGYAAYMSETPSRLLPGVW